MLAARRRVACLIAMLIWPMTGAASAPDVELVFVPAAATEAYEARVYGRIWSRHGAEIIAALERRTCLPFVEPRVAATVDEAVSHSGGPEHPMRLRSSYTRKTKQSTLVHELGHRHLWQLEERLDGIDGHMTLFLVLDRVWADVWGETFAAERARGESQWGDEYAEAWAWAQSLTRGERAEIWRTLLRQNGFPDACPALLE